MRRMLCLIIGLLGSGGILAMLIIQQPSYSAAKEDLCFTPAESSTENVLITDSQISVTLPISVNGTSLIAEKLVRYDGAFLEGNSNCEVVNLAALLLRNTSEQGVSYASVTLKQGSRELVFCATYIPPGAAVLVLEKSGKQFSKDLLVDCCAEIIWDSTGWRIEDVLSIEMIDIGSLCVKNISEKPLSQICLYYKTRYAEGLFYLGGITYEVPIEYLAPGECVLLKPEHYAGKSSGFVRVQYTVRNDNASRAEA